MSVTVDRLVAEIEANPAGAIAALRAFDTVMDASTRDRDASVDVEVANAITELGIFSGVIDAATRDRTIHVDVDVDRGLSGLATTLGGLQGAAEGVQDALAGVAKTAAGAAGGGGGGGPAGGISGFAEAASSGQLAAARFAGATQGLVGAFASMIPMVVGFMAVGTLLPGLFAAAAGGAGILVGALAPLVGLLGLLIPAIGAFVAVFGTVFAGLAGVISGIQAYRDASEGAAQATLELQNRQDALRSAQQGLANAIHGVTMAQRELKKAQEQMREAPLEAAEALEDAHIAAAQAALNERKAIIALEQAQANLAAAQQKTSDVSYELTKQTDDFTGKMYDVAYASSEAVDGALNERDARLAVQQAELDLLKARDANSDAQRELTKMEKKGIKNSDIMVAARERLSNAEYNLAQAHQSVANAQRQVAQAQAALNDAIQNGTAATNQWKEAMERLSPEGIEFVKFVSDEFLPALGDIGKGVQTAMLPGIQDGLEAFLDMTDEVENELSIIGKMIGDTFAEFFEFWGKPRQQRLLTEMFESLNDLIFAGLQLVRPFSRILVSLLDAAAPVLTDIIKGLNRELRQFANWLETDKGKEKTKDFFENAAHFGGLWLDVMKPLVGIFGGIADAAKPLAEKWLRNMAEDLQGISDWVNSQEGKETLRGYFEDAMDILGNLKDTVGDLLGVLFGTNEGKNSAFYKFLTAIREDFIPEFRKFWKWLDENDVMSKIVSGFSELADFAGDTNLASVLKIVGGIFWALDKIVGSFDWLNKHAPGLGDALRLILDPAYLLQWTFDKLADGMSLFKENAGNIKRAWDSFRDWVKDHIIDPLQDIIDKMGEVKDAFTDWVPDWLSPGDEGGAFDLGRANPLDSDGLIPGAPDPFDLLNQFGGPVKAGKPIIVGEKRPEVFIPSVGGRIAPSTDALSSTGGGMDPDQLEAILNRVLDRAKPDVQMENHFEEKADPKHIARELAWSLT